MRNMTTETRKGKLPFASGHASKGWTLNFKGRDLSKEVRKKYNPLPHLFNQAIDNPGVKQSYFFEENGYEYEAHATWDPETQTMLTNQVCPYRYGHHVGSICSCCGQKD